MDLGSSFSRMRNWMGTDQGQGTLGRLSAIGTGIGQLANGQTPDIGGAWDAVQQRMQTTALGKQMRDPALLDQFTPQQRQMLAALPPAVASQLIAEKIFAPPPEPVGPEYRDFNGNLYDMNATDPATGMPAVVIPGTPKPDQHQLDRQQRNADWIAAGKMPDNKDPEYVNWMLTGKTGDGKLVEINTGDRSMYGNAPEGTVWVLDANGDNVMETDPISGDPRPKTVPIGGSKADIDARDAAAKAAANTDKSTKTQSIMLTDLGRARDIIENNPISTSAIGATVNGVIPGTDASNVDSLLSGVTANISFDALAQMRAASPTGAGLGAITPPELKLLSDSSGAISGSQGRDQRIANIARLQQQANEIINIPADQRLDWSNAKWNGKEWVDAATGQNPNPLPPSNTVSKIASDNGISQQEWDAMSEGDRKTWAD